ncbi:MAG: 50S ribosomal protein L1 [Halanaerobiales bacterium]|nr:50S ribosomal protein L1 [Halanaerobiales bacterium]
MAKLSKRYQEALEKVDRNKFYEPKDAIELVKNLASANFDETVEFSAKLGVNPKHADQNIRGTLVLPNGTGQEVKIVVFAKGEKAREAEEAGADFVGQDDLAEKINDGWLDFDLAIATPDMMSVVGPLGRVLGPKGLMPNPKAGTVTFDLAESIEEFKAGKLEYRVDSDGNMHLPIGKASFEVNDLVENFKKLMDVLMIERPASSKGKYFRSITVSSTMSPGVKIDITNALKLIGR